ncbi:MAG: ribosome hibernation-promoting factor, HPF/YfiA family [Bacilli bacterium]
MKIMIRGSKVEVTNSMKNMIEKKLSKVNKFIADENKECKVVIKQQHRNYKIEITINTPYFLIRAEALNDDMYSTIDLVVSKLERQLRKTNAKLKKHKNVSVFSFEEFNNPTIEEDSLIEKRKTVELKPMSEEEAILQLELIGHSFYIFKNSDTNSVCLLYKKGNGNYGIIETN